MTTILLLGFLLVLLVSPFSALAPLVIILVIIAFVLILTLMGWTLLKALVTSASAKSDRVAIENRNQHQEKEYPPLPSD